MTAFTLSNGALTARVVDTGAALVDLRLAGLDQPLVLGFADLADYETNAQFFGSVVGRVANRVGPGPLTLDGVPVVLDQNAGPYHLHGGATGFSTRVFRAELRGPAAVAFHYDAADGEEGYPGALAVTALYEAAAPATLRLTLTATTTKPTFVNLAHHAYLNLAGEGSIAEHVLEIAADSYLPGDDSLTPTGEIRPVADTVFDFRRPRRIGRASERGGVDYNHNFCLARATRAEPAFAARLSAAGRPTLEIWTTQPGLQLYDGYKIRASARGLDGRRMGPGDALALEGQGWPDAPRKADFPSIRLDPGQVYRQVTEYRFLV